ncbi:cytochrome c [Paludisphaera borealis]|uniref:Cytochrome c n=1 Tax=Paludisphaera borealis TaxID=1387353 RepID=A0A1U7CUC6_9BACT|nr:cytochrome c [Paludisphaera borealis]APW62532.1 hypothetical protein BSF38_04080 [Paludisphaera borealis]
MKRLACVVSVIAFSAVSVWAGGDDDKKPATIKEVMKKLHKGADAPLNKLKTAFKADSPDWKSIQDLSKGFVTLGADLPKNDAPKGDKADFKKLAEAYYENAKALDAGAKKKDKPAAEAAFKKVSTSCMACHKDHKPD